MVALGLLMAGTSMLKVSGDKGEGAATTQKLCYGSAAASSRYAQRDLRRPALRLHKASARGGCGPDLGSVR